MDRIAVINASTVLTDAQIAPMVAAVNIQIDKHFYPAWGKQANLKLVPKGAKPPKGYWQATILDDSDQAGALGYHDITIEGLPLSKIFAGTDLKNGYSVSVTLSHEILEMLADPDVNLLVQDGVRARRFWAYEACDAVEADALGYAINGVQVSDFVLPEYFETFRSGVRTDYLGHLIKPVPALTPGGYMAYVENGVWNQVFADHAGRNSESHGSSAIDPRELWKARPTYGGRRYRRSTPREQWIRSTVEVE